jgi:molecular chaperone GrpE
MMMKRKSTGRGDPEVDKSERAETTSEEAPPEEMSAEETPTAAPERAGERSEDPDGVRKERDEYLDHLKRLKAEFDNYRKRTDRERLEWTRQAVQGFVGDLLPRIDDLERAIEASASSGEDSSLQQGVRMILDQLRKQLEEHGLRPIESVGQPFDPTIHDAVLQVTDDEHPDKTVIEELRKGYTFHGRVIRPAQVKIARSTGPGREGEPTGAGDGNA